MSPSKRTSAASGAIGRSRCPRTMSCRVSTPSCRIHGSSSACRSRCSPSCCKPRRCGKARRVERKLELDDGSRRVWIVCDLVLAHARGMIADGVIVHGFEVIDHLDWAAWLEKHGASELALASPLVRGIYDYVFGYLEGDVRR